MPPVLQLGDEAWQLPEWLSRLPETSTEWSETAARKVTSWIDGAPTWIAMHDAPYVCDPRYDWTKSDGAMVQDSIEKVRQAFAADYPLEHLPLLPCTIALVPILLVTSLLPLCCFALCCRRRHAYIKLEDEMVPATPPRSRPFVPGLTAAASLSRLSRSPSASSMKSAAAKPPPFTPNGMVAEDDGSGANFSTKATPGSMATGGNVSRMKDLEQGTGAGLSPDLATCAGVHGGGVGGGCGGRSTSLLSLTTRVGESGFSRRRASGSRTSSPSKFRLVTRSAPPSPDHFDSDARSGHMSIKDALPEFERGVTKEGKPLVRTNITPLPSLRSYIKKKGKMAIDVLSNRTRASSPPQLPGTNDYPMAAVLFRLQGAPETGEDAPDSARSGQSTFRQNSARWRTPRSHIDNAPHNDRIKLVRGRTVHSLSPEAKQVRQALRRKRDEKLRSEREAERAIFERDAEQFERMQERVRAASAQRALEGFAVLKA